MPYFKCPVCQHVSSVEEGKGTFTCPSCEASLPTSECLPVNAPDAAAPAAPREAATPAGATNPYKAPATQPRKMPSRRPSGLESWFWGPLNGLVGGVVGMLISTIWLVSTLIVGQARMAVVPPMMMAIALLTFFRGVVATRRRIEGGETLADQLKLDLVRWGIQIALAGVLMIVALVFGGFALFKMKGVHDSLMEEVEAEVDYEYDSTWE